mmetsp:Transcript_22427/g.51381  ORF Transcript_22427/g.51381 Transcript_22427/m.51381 type:complete len:291 (+) Transcript_22427:317-1189(+)
MRPSHLRRPLHQKDDGAQHPRRGAVASFRRAHRPGSRRASGQPVQLPGDARTRNDPRGGHLGLRFRPHPGSRLRRRLRGRHGLPQLSGARPLSARRCASRTDGGFPAERTGRRGAPFRHRDALGRDERLRRGGRRGTAEGVRRDPSRSERPRGTRVPREDRRPGGCGRDRPAGGGTEGDAGVLLRPGDRILAVGRGAVGADGAGRAGGDVRGRSVGGNAQDRRGPRGRPGSASCAAHAGGGGAFGNQLSWIVRAISNALERVEEYGVGLDVRIVHFRNINSMFEELERGI